ncbi:MAG: hypothetical protein ABEI39_00005, partial [Halobacteriales archaeon]
MSASGDESTSGDGTGGLRIVAVAVLVLLLGATVGGANAAVAAERTVLNAEFVKTTLEEEEAYDPLQSAVVATAEEELALNGTVDDLPVETENLIEEAVPPAYVEGQVETNVDRIYAYLQGDRENLTVAVNLTPVKRNVADFIAGRIRNTSTRELFLAVAGESTTVEVQNVTIDLADIAGMAESESAYEAARTEFRADVRRVVVNRAVNRTFRQASNDQLLALVIEGYDPRNYTATQKEQLVSEREPEIKDALETRLRENTDLNESVDEQLRVVHDEFTTAVRDTVSEEAGAIDPALAEPSADLAALWVDGLTTDMSYGTFAERVAENKSALAAAIGGVVADRLDEAAPDRLDLTSEIGPSTRENLETVGQGVGIVGWLVYLLPLLALV